jgi:hypothetical protein
MNKKAHYGAYKRMAKDPSLSQTNSLYIFILHFKTFYEYHPSIKTYVFPKWSLLSRCPNKTVFVLLIYCMHASSSAPLIFSSLN